MKIENTSSLHLRVPTSVLERLNTEAVRQRRSVASLALVLLEEALDGAPVQAVHVQDKTDLRPAVLASRSGLPDDRLLVALLHDAITDSGFDAPAANGGAQRRCVTIRTARAAFHGAKPEVELRTRNAHFTRALDRLMAAGEVVAEADRIWLEHG